MTRWVGKYFTDDEFECQCRCGANLVHLRLVEILDKARRKLGVPLEVSSGVRCMLHNRSVGGRPNSYHQPQTLAVDGSKIDLGLASDITFAQRHLRQPINIIRLYTLLESYARPTSIGLGLYPTWVHIDVRGVVGKSPARWDESFPWPRL